MTTGFDAVFDDLHHTASRITDTITGVEALPWNGPSGEYGNAAVQSGWGRFIESARFQVDGLRGKANEHGDLVRTAAGRYQSSDEDSGRALSGISALLNP